MPGFGANKDSLKWDLKLLSVWVSLKLHIELLSEQELQSHY